MYQFVLEKIKEFNVIIIHRHHNPDGDALGSQIGLKESILATFPDKKVYCVGDYNSRLAFIGEMDNINDDVYNNALVFVLDSSARNMINDNRYQKGAYVIKIDHHISNEDYGDYNIVETAEISCASLLAKIIFENRMKLTTLGARALFTGIVTDSGRFRYDAVTKDTFAIAARLLEYRFDLAEIYQFLYTEEWDVVLLKAKMVMKIKFTSRQVAYMITTQKELLEYQVDFLTVSRGMVNVMAGIKNVDIWVNITEDENKKMVIEMRSSKYNINPVALKYGGGGHKMACGCTIESQEIDNLLADLDQIMEE